ncbi:hypothetical protein ACN3XK_71790 [Actinomadura welshii]
MDMDGILDDIWMWVVRKVIEWALGSFQTLMIWWMDDTAYSVRLSGESGGVLFRLRAHTNWLTAIMAFAGFLVAAFRVAIQRKGEPFRVALSQFFELAVIMLTLATAVNLANIAGDEYSAWILEDLRPKNDNWIANWVGGLEFLGGGGGSATATMFIVVVFAGAAAISSVAQFALMLFRSGVLIVLVGILPAVAASRFSSYGNHAYRKCIGWLISFILFKPVAATIYAAALALMESPHEADRLFGLALVAGGIFALPAILRAVMPAVAEDNSHFGVRQIGHFVFGSTAVNSGRGINVLSGSKHGAGRVGRGLFGRGGDSVTAVTQKTDWGAGPGPWGRAGDGGVPGTGPGGGLPGRGPGGALPGRGPGGDVPGGGGPGGGVPGGPGEAGSGGGGRTAPGGPGPSGAPNAGAPGRTTSGATPAGASPAGASPAGASPAGAPPGGGQGGGRTPGGSDGGASAGAGGVQLDGPQGAGTAAGSPSGFHVPDYQVPGFEPPEAPRSAENSRPGYTPPSIRDAIDEVRGTSGGAGGGGGNAGPSGNWPV